MPTIDHLRHVLDHGLAPERLEIVDDSARHAGHGPHAGSGSHVAITIVAAAFAGQSRIERHRRVHALLAQDLAGGLHALSLTTLSPDEARALAG